MPAPPKLAPVAASYNAPRVAAPAAVSTLNFSAHRLDVQAFASAGGLLTGAQPLSAMPRLLAEAHPGAAADPATWQARGALRNPSGARQATWLHLQAQMQIGLTCQRCLEPVFTQINVTQDYRFVDDEATAQAQDDESEEDVMALALDFDLLALLEDELLMALPISPRHTVCTRTLPGQDASYMDETPHPFASLQVLKNKL